MGRWPAPAAANTIDHERVDIMGKGNNSQKNDKKNKKPKKETKKPAGKAAGR